MHLSKRISLQTILVIENNTKMYRCSLCLWRLRTSVFLHVDSTNLIWFNETSSHSYECTPSSCDFPLTIYIWKFQYKCRIRFRPTFYVNNALERNFQEELMCQFLFNCSAWHAIYAHYRVASPPPPPAPSLLPQTAKNKFKERTSNIIILKFNGLAWIATSGIYGAVSPPPPRATSLLQHTATIIINVAIINIIIVKWTQAFP
jgi:hypothetical protein